MKMQSDLRHSSSPRKNTRPVLKRLVRSGLNSLGYDLSRLPTAKRGQALGIPDESFYQPVFSPWLGYGEFADYAAIAKPYTLVAPDRCHILLALARQAANLGGDWIECGVYKGGTAMILAKAIADGKLPPRLHLFDTFRGMPDTDPELDLHKQGDFGDTDLQSVRKRVRSAGPGAEDQIIFHPGLIPETFAGSGVEAVSFAHVDVDIHKAVRDCCEFIYPRMPHGGIIVFDDYGYPSCPGARKAVDEFFEAKPEIPLVLPTGQALVIKYAPAELQARASFRPQG